MAKHVYIHIPFCTNKCHYCDFNVFVWQGEEWVWQYLEALEREMMRTVEIYPPKNIETIYVGGGTPSILDEKQLEALFAMIYRYFPHFDESGEFTMEANPGTLTLEKLKVMRDGGVNRLSIGVQTFDPQLLKRLGRIHSGEDAVHAVDLARRAGIENISLDLMLGLPAQTKEQVIFDLNMVRSLNVEHLSAYLLKIEEKTLFYKWWNEGTLTLPGEDAEVEIYLALVEILKEYGFLHYEISNFARPGRESRHNLAYWEYRDYYGIGAGAHGYINGIRHENIGPIRPYMKATHSGLPQASSWKLTDQEKMEEMMFLGLRLCKGISFYQFEQVWGMPLWEVYGEEIANLQNKGLLEVTQEGIRLTTDGILLGNEVFQSFLKEKG